MENIIEITNVDVFYENVSALSNINLNIKSKEFLAIIGPNGGGKSTLLKLILGFRKPNRGKVTIVGQQPRKARKIIGYVPQFTKFDKKFPISVREVILMGKLGDKIKLFHRFSNEDKYKADLIMKKLNIYEFRDRQISQLSGGQLQRVLIARALLIEPKILLLDEPTASLDETSKFQIYEVLKELNKNITIIIVTHDINIISKYTTNIACIDNKVYYHGEVQCGEDVIKQVYGCSIDSKLLKNIENYNCGKKEIVND